MKVGVNSFVTRQTRESRFSYYDGSFAEVAALAEKHLASGKRGYRDGVLEVEVPPERFYTGVVALLEGAKLVGVYEARRKGEQPRKHVCAVDTVNSKIPAQGVTLILYRKDVLAENAENTTDCEWELISINARLTVGEEPINPGALMSNHFGMTGGTATKMTDSEFVAALKVACEYWRDKAMAG
jgi:hypothetical protein